MPQLTVHLVINTRSREGQKSMNYIVDAFTSHGITLAKVHKLRRRSDTNSVYHTIKRSKPALVVLCGGDGTVSSGLSALAGSGLEIAIIPLGTTNNFARSLKLPLTIDEAVDCALNCKALPVDLGKIGNDYFANVAGIGISAAIAQNVNHTVKKYMGRFAYVLSGASQAIRHKPFMVTLQDPSKKLLFHFETHQLIIANGRYHAGRQIAADASVDDNRLIIFALGGRRRLSLLWHTLDFYLGRRKKIIHSSYMIGHDVTISTSRKQSIEVDGEVHKSTPISVRTSPGAVHVRRPK